MAVFENKTRVDISKVDSNALITNKGLLSLLENTACFYMHAHFPAQAGCAAALTPQRGRPS